MERPNVLLITSDQHHYQCLGHMGSAVRTPALDALAREGTVFTRAYCTNPVCSPSRSSIITGLYPAWHHCWTIGVKLPEDVPTVGDILQRHGTATALIGKAHFQPLASAPGSESLECMPTLRDLDFWRGFHGPWYGFEHVETSRNHADESHVGQHYAIWMEDQGFKEWRDYFRPWPTPKGFEPPYIAGNGRAWTLPERFHYTNWTADRTVARLEHYAEQRSPFFLWASFHDPHPPYLVPEPWASTYDPRDMRPGTLADGEMERLPPPFRETQKQRPDFSSFEEPGGNWCHGFHSHLIDRDKLKKDMAAYFGMISFMDAAIGRVLARLESLGLAENTLVVFTTDHGHFLGQHGLIAKGAFHFEDLVRVPLICRLPGRVPAGRRDTSLQSLVDLPATFLRARGVPVPGHMQGKDQFDVWCGESERARDHVLVENRHQPTRLHLRTYVDERYKLTVYRGADYGELFDLQRDPQELCNLWDEPDAQELRLRLMHRFLQAEMEREPTRMARIAPA